MKTIKIQGAGLLFVAVLFVLITGASQVPVENRLIGFWEMDTTQADFKTIKEAMPASIDISRQGNEITIKKDLKQEGIRTDKLTINAQPVEVKMTTPGYRKWCALKLGADGKNIQVVSDYKVEKDEQGNAAFSYKRTETYQLSEEGKTLTVSDVAQGDKGKDFFQAVYKKRP
jgi:hypothetical protein